MFCQKSGLIHDTCFFSPGETFFTSCRGVTRRKKFWLCTGRPPLPNWGLTRPPNMPKVSPGGAPRTLDGLCTEDAPTGFVPSRRPLELLRWVGEETTSQHLQPQAPSVAAARDARGKRKQLTLASAKKLQFLWQNCKDKKTTKHCWTSSKIFS